MTPVRVRWAVCLALCLAFAWMSPVVGTAAESPDEVEIAIYGGTPAGIAAAVRAGGLGRRVVLVDPYRHVGGMVTNGLSHADFRTFEGLTGTYRDFTRRVERHYADKYGADSPQARDCFHGAFGEPRVNRIVFEQMLAEVPTVQVRTGLRLVGVEPRPGGSEVTRISSARFTDADGHTVSIRAAVFVDASYEGDLMAAAGVPYRIGREARSEYGEPLAPETADAAVQGYNFRLVLTRDPELRVPPAAPDGYRRDEFLPVLPLIESGQLNAAFVASSGGVYKAHEPPLPEGKHDVNDVSRGAVRLSLPEISDAWPDGNAATRSRIFDEHRRHNVGLLYFLQHDPAVPAAFRDGANEWGLCRDEFPETAHLPEQLYIREGRRMVGREVFTERHTDYAPRDARAMLRADAVAMGDYGPNCHGTGHEGPRIGGRHTGEFYKPTAPYQIPLGVILPSRCENLLVPVACSASHVGFCALRYEPIWASLGDAAGVTAHLAIARQKAVQDVPVSAVQRLLHDRGAATIYVSDVSPDSPDFAAVQWWGTAGGLHGLNPSPETPGQRGAHIASQYFEAFPGHAADLDRPLTPTVRRRWTAIAADLGLPAEPLAAAATRGAFVRTAHRLYRSR